MSWYDFRWHLFGRIVIFGFTMLAVLVGSYIAQENQARDEVRTVCVASWDCETGRRTAPAPDASTLIDNRTTERTP